MKKMWKRALSTLLVLAMTGMTACGGSGSAPAADPGAASSAAPSAAQPAAPAPSADGAKIIYSNGGPEEFFETPWLNPGTYT